MIIPTIQENTLEGNKVYDIFSLLLEKRIIFLNGEINDSISSLIVSELLYLDSVNNDDIYLYINSPGGSVTSGLAIYDTMNYIKSDVQTIGIGNCASMGAILLSSGKKGKRFCLPNTEVMIHEVASQSEGKATDIKLQSEHIEYLKVKLNKILSKNTNKQLSKINNDTYKDHYMSSKEALDYGLIDKIITG